SGDTVTAYGIANLKGGSGNNDFVFQNGASISGMITGGSGGINELDYSAYTSAITVDLATGTATGTGGISNIHSVVDGSGNDTLTGGSGNDTFILSNGWGSDTITGGGGSDTLDFSSVTSNLTFTIDTNGTISVTDGTDTVTATGIANLKGGSDNNYFVFQNGASISGTITGGSGSVNQLNYSAYTAAVSVNLSAGTATGTAGISNIHSVIGGSANDTFVTDSAGDTLNGGAGNDT